MSDLQKYTEKLEKLEKKQKYLDKCNKLTFGTYTKRLVALIIGFCLFNVELSYVLSADAGHRGGRLCGAPHLSNAPASDGSAARIQLLWDSTGISGAVGGLFRKLLRGERQCTLWRRFARHVF